MSTISIDKPAAELASKLTGDLEATASTLAERTAELATAKAAEGDMVRQLTAGRPATSALELVTARAEVERSELLHGAAKRAHSRIERQANAADLAVAAELASLLQHEDLFPVSMTLALTLPEKLDLRKVPHAYLVQNGAPLPERSKPGVETVNLTLHLVAKSKLVAGPTATEVERKLDRLAGWKVEVVKGVPELLGTLWSTPYSLRVTRGWRAVPDVTGGEGGTGGLAGLFAENVRAELSAYRFSPRANIKVINSTVTVEDGVCRERVTVVAYAASIEMDVAWRAEVARNALLACRDVLVIGRGVVRDLELLDHADVVGEPLDVEDVVARFTFVRKPLPLDLPGDDAMADGYAYDDPYANDPYEAEMRAAGLL